VITKIVVIIRKKKEVSLENPGIDPGTSRMLSGRMAFELISQFFSAFGYKTIAFLYIAS